MLFLKGSQLSSSCALPSLTFIVINSSFAILLVTFLRSQMDGMFIAVSLDGKLDDFYNLIRECPNILEEVDKMLVDNPMHLAAINGHTHFAVEIMRLKPSFAKRLNPDGFSPLQLALQNAHIQTVLRLIAIDKDLVRVQGREGMSPLHYVAKHGNNQLLSVFLGTNPTALEDVTIRNQTALHIALENDHVDCIETILKCYERSPQSGREEKHLNWKDENENTPLHIATTRKQTQVVRALIGRQVDVNAINLAGLTALGISEQPGELGSDEISTLLRSAGASSAILPPTVNAIEPSLSVNELLKVAARRGDIEMLYTLIRKDPYVLDDIDRIPFVDTPLHISASVGHIGFASETMFLKPSFARKLNQDGLTPLHLALLKNKTEIVYRLLDADSDLIRVQGKKGKTPLHYATEQGKISILIRFLLWCPSSIEDVTNQRETALHIAIESRKFNVFCLLVERLRIARHEGSSIQEYMTLNQKNDLGNTALHLAVKTLQPEVVRVLIDNHAKLNVKNSDGFTALEILELDNSEVNNREAREVIKEMLRSAGAFKSSSYFCWWKSSKSLSCPSISSTSLTNVTVEVASNASPPPTPSTVLASNHESVIALEGQPQGNNVNANNLPSPTISLLERWVIDISRCRKNLSEESRNMTLVALVLFATIAYQSVLSPPGGVWQGDNNNYAATHDNKSSSQIHRPGTVIMGHWSFLFFMMFNSLAIALLTNAIDFLVMESGPYCCWRITRHLLTTLTPLCYAISLQTISPNASLFAAAIGIPVILFILLPCTHNLILSKLEYRTLNWISRYPTHGPATDD